MSPQRLNCRSCFLEVDRPLCTEGSTPGENGVKRVTPLYVINGNDTVVKREEESI